jgi:hypothetical protein
MRAAHFLCAMAMCGPLVLEAGAAELAAQDSTAVSGTARSAGPTSHDPDPNKNVVPAVAPSRGAINALHGSAQLGRSNADRVRSLLHKQSPRTVARAASGPLASKRAVPTPAVAGTRRSASPVVPISPPALARLSPVRTALRASTGYAVPDRGSSIGGASITNPGRVGGSVKRRAANPGAIDGTQVRRR